MLSLFFIAIKGTEEETMDFLIIVFGVVSVALVLALGVLIFILCEFLFNQNLNLYNKMKCNFI